jgi:hypothetical protein
MKNRKKYDRKRRKKDSRKIGIEMKRRRCEKTERMREKWKRKTVAKAEGT